MIRHEIKDFRGLSYSARFLRKGEDDARETAVFVTIPAGVGGAAGAGSEIITEGDQVKVPSETLDFSLEQSVSVPVQPN